MEITKLTTQAKNSDRVNIFVDGKFYRGLDKFVVAQMGLRVGLTLGSNLIKKLDDSATDNDAWEYALKSLRYSAKSTGMLKEKLKKRFSEETAKNIITKLINSKILDDNELASNLVTRYMEQRQKSRRQIILWFKIKKFAKEVIDRATESLDEAYEREVALKLAHKKYNQLEQDMDWFKKREKISMHLSQKGFNYGIIRTIVTKEILAEPKQFV